MLLWIISLSAHRDGYPFCADAYAYHLAVVLAFGILHSWYFFHGSPTQSVVAPLFVLMLFSLLRSYESYDASSTIFNAFLFTGLAGFIVPCVVWISPFVFFYMIYLRSLSAKTFFAGIIGLTLPYWFLFSYGVYTDNISLVVPYLSACVQFHPFTDYALLSISQIVSLASLLLLFIVYGAFYMQSAFKDKVQTRIMLTSIFWMGVWTFLLILLQPRYLNALLPAAAVSTAVLGGHLFALSFGRVVRIVFYSTIILLVLLLVFNQWIHLFIS